MTIWLRAVGTESFSMFWGPLLGWTALASVFLFGLWMARSLHPLYGYRLRQAVLFSLPLAMLVAPFVGGVRQITALAPLIPTVSLGMGSVELAVTNGMATPLQLGPLVAGVVLALWGCVAAGGLVSLSVSICSLRRLEKPLTAELSPALLRRVRSMKRDLAVLPDVVIRVGWPGSVPMTFGWWRPTIVIPPELLGTASRFEMAVAHELIHVRRRDFAWGVLERVVQRVFALHPLVWILGQSIDAFREASCDNEVLTSVDGDPESYGELLLNLSTRSAPALAAGMTRRTSKLKRRMEIMTRFVEAPRSTTRPTRSVLAAGLVAGVVGFGGACTSGETGARESTPVQLTSEFPSIVGGDREAVLQRLEVQMTYLDERISELTDSIETIPDQMGSPRFHKLQQQLGLLNNMFFERLETVETLRLEVETERRLSGL